jgi:hypothetical protein
MPETPTAIMASPQHAHCINSGDSTLFSELGKLSPEFLEVADIIPRHGAAYRARVGPALAPSQRRALRDLAACRTPARGGHVHQCAQCGRTVYTYHSCGNRHCPKCHRL